MRRIREFYSVPAKRGGRVRYTFGGASREGTITGTTRTQMYLRVRLDGDKYPRPFHPTWHLEYLQAPP